MFCKSLICYVHIIYNYNIIIQIKNIHFFHILYRKQQRVIILYRQYIIRGLFKSSRTNVVPKNTQILLLQILLD